MKLFKMSLAAVVALGALSSVASATPLEEAIKDVDVSGFGRYRYDSTNTENTTKNATTNVETKTKNSDAFHRFTLDANFKAALDDNFFSVVGVRYDARDISGDHRNVNVGSNVNGFRQGVNSGSHGWGGSNGESFSVRQYYVGYQVDALTLLAGRQPLGTYFTDDMLGTGIKAVYSGVDGMTFAALAMDDLEDDGDISSSGLGQIVGLKKGGNGGYTYQQNLYGVAALGDFDMVNVQLWGAYLENETFLYALDLGLNYDISDDFNVHGKANLAYTAIKGGFKDDVFAGVNGAKADKTMFWGLTAGLSASGFDFDAGYLKFGKDDRYGLSSFEDNGGFIVAGEDLLDYTLYNGENKYWFVTAKYTMDQYSVGADYVQGDVKYEGAQSKDKNKEIVGRLGYKYNEKLNFTSYYSWVEEKKDNIKDKSHHFRFEARYNF